MDSSSERLERIIRPIVEGQIRGFLKEHPCIVEAVNWYKPRKDKAQTFTNSLAKRIVRDLTCGNVAARLEAVFLDSKLDTPPESVSGIVSAGAGSLEGELGHPSGVSGTIAGHPVHPLQAITDG